MIRAENLFKSFGESVVLKGVSFSLEQGEFIGLIGPSGGGKSVLLKILGGVILPDVPPDGRESIMENPESVGFLFQEGALFDSMSVLENVLFPLFCKRDLRHSQSGTQLSQAEGFERAEEILTAVGLINHYRKLPGQLSGGMRRRVAIARALIGRPELVLLDDPTGGLDPVAASVIINLIQRLHQQFRPTMVLVSHDIRRLLPSVDRVLALFDGKLVMDLPPADIFEKAPTNVVKFLATRYDFSQPVPGAALTVRLQGRPATPASSAKPKVLGENI